MFLYCITLQVTHWIKGQHWKALTKKLLYMLQASGTLLASTWTLRTTSCNQSRHPMGVAISTALTCLGVGLMGRRAAGLCPEPGRAYCMQWKLAVAVKFTKRLQNCYSEITCYTISAWDAMNAINKGSMKHVLNRMYRLVISVDIHDAIQNGFIYFVSIVMSNNHKRCGHQGLRTNKLCWLQWSHLLNLSIM